MTITRNAYTVETTHPTGYRDGEHRLEVTTNADGKTRFVTGRGFGCSRDYAAKTDKAAIEAFLCESMMKAVKIQKSR